MEKYQLENKIAIITGSAMGIGKATARILAEAGCTVIIADIDMEGEETARQICQEGNNALFIQTDIQDEKSVEHLRDETLSRYGHIDILINNAAKQDVLPFSETTPSSFRKVIDINLCGTYNCTKIISDVMPEGGRIINCLSVHWEVPRLEKYAYDASKAGIAMLTKETALALAERKITVNGISYGAVRTPMNSDWMDDAEKAEQVKKNIPLRWIAEDEEIAESIKTILEDFSSRATGSIFTIDGGRSLK